MEVRNFILPENVNEDIEKGLTTNKQAWASFAAAAGLMFGDDVAVAIGAAVSDGALPIGDLIALGIGMAIVVQIFMNYQEIWEKANEIVVTQEPENQVYTTPEAEPETIEHTASVPPEVETQLPGFDVETVEDQNHTGNQTQQEVNWDDYIFESRNRRNNRRRNVQGHDAEGGHTRDRHIGKADQWLRNRQREDGIKDSSGFTNSAAANLTQARFVKAYKKEIKEWLGNKKATRPFVGTITMNRVIGTAVPGKGKARPTKKARIVLAKDGSELGYHIVTSFPIP